MLRLTHALRRRCNSAPKRGFKGVGFGRFMPISCSPATAEAVRVLSAGANRPAFEPSRQEPRCRRAPGLLLLTRRLLEIGEHIMSAETLLIILFVGLVAGWLAGQIVRGTGFGLVADIAIGIVGALIGSWLLPHLGIHLGSGIVPAIIGATIGAIVLLLILRLAYRRGRW